MIISRYGLNLIKDYEGLSLEYYTCPAGKHTIGYGHVLELEGERSKHLDELPPSFVSKYLTIDGVKITEQTAEKLLLEDIEKIYPVMAQYISVPLTQGQFDALVSLIYNWGTHHFEKSAGLKCLNNKDYAQAAIEFFSKEKGVVEINGEFSQGLYNRRQAELTLLWEFGS